MLYKLLRKVVLLGILTALASCGSQATLTSTPEPQTNPEVTGEIVLADISDNAQNKIRRFQPLADYLAANLSQFDIGRGKVKIAPDMETMVQWLKSGEVDLYFDSPYPTMLAIEASGAKPILCRWKRGYAEYHTVIFTMPDRGIASLADLKGKMVAFDHRFSTTGYMLPFIALLEAGLNPVEKSSASAAVGADDVGYVFTDEDENSIEWAISDKVAASAVDVRAFVEVPEEIRRSMIILAETEKVARNVVIVRPDMDPEQVKAIKILLLSMDETSEGQAVLEKFEGTTKFDEFSTQKSLNRMRELYQKVQSRSGT
ncbi:MAG: phosphate/phosphite/phosphonate ABC transporter substrate-binding protein [Xenococcaceae cyanobacterium]